MDAWYTLRIFAGRMSRAWRDTVAVSRWSVVVLVSVLASALFIGLGGYGGHAGLALAHPADYSPDSLSAMMLSNADVNNVVGPDDSVTDVADGSPAIDSTIRAVRTFKTNKGILIVSLFANADGSAPSSDAQNQVIGGSYLNDLANSIFTSTDTPVDGGSIGVADRDRIVSFNGQLNGANWDSTAVLFVKGAVYGVVLWASPVNDPVTDGVITGSLYSAQVAKLS